MRSNSIDAQEVLNAIEYIESSHEEIAFSRDLKNKLTESLTAREWPDLEELKIELGCLLHEEGLDEVCEEIFDALTGGE